MSSRGPQNIVRRAAIGPRAASLRPLLSKIVLLRHLKKEVLDIDMDLSGLRGK